MFKLGFNQSRAESEGVRRYGLLVFSLFLVFRRANASAEEIVLYTIHFHLILSMPRYWRRLWFWWGGKTYTARMLKVLPRRAYAYAKVCLFVLSLRTWKAIMRDVEAGLVLNGAVSGVARIPFTEKRLQYSDWPWVILPMRLWLVDLFWMILRFLL